MIARRTLVWVVAPMLLAGCASQPLPKGLAANPEAPASSATIISRSELEQHVSPSNTALQAIQTLRPTFLTYRGQIGFKKNTGLIQVSVDGGQLQSQDILGVIPVSNIAAIRYYSATDAMQKFGAAAANGPVIEVKQR